MGTRGPSVVERSGLNDRRQSALRPTPLNYDFTKREQPVSTLPSEVIETDHSLETVVNKTTESLAAHRWHWTLDESNPQRVSIREYGRGVGRHFSGVARMVNGYAAWLAETLDVASVESTSTLGDHIVRAGMSAETEAVAEAVANAHGITMQTVQVHHRTEVRRVRDAARQRAEQRGTSIAEEAPRIAETIVRSEQAQQAESSSRGKNTDLRFLQMERYLISANRDLARAVQLAPQVTWNDEHRELLTETLSNVKSLLGLLDSAISGMSSTDWDAEFARFGNAS
jgi:hypothetical protein